MIIGTAGHIDHGKSALVTALTGRPVDRLAEERRRGITIDLNFAPLEFEGLPPAGIVDVPGHEDFVRTMVAGASGIDLVLLVVDASQGAQPQTWEHLAIVEQLRIPAGIPVLTKADLADPEWLGLVRVELMDRLTRSPVAFEEPGVVSAVTGQGIDDLRQRLRRRVAAAPVRHQGGRFRMPVDRAFSIAGVGTVVTGTPWSGSVGIGSNVVVLPAGTAARVRSVEAYGRPVDLGGPGARTAVGLAGVARESVQRGDVLVGAEAGWQSTMAFDAAIDLLPGAPPLRRRLRVHLHLGTSEVLARLYPAHGLVRVALESPVITVGGDRFVLRSYSPVHTIGGGRVVDPRPPRRSGWPEGLGSEDPAVVSAALIARRAAGIASSELEGLSGVVLDALPPGIVAVGDRLIPEAVVRRWREAVLAQVTAFHAREPMERGLSIETVRRALRAPREAIDAVLDALVAEGVLVVRAGLAALPGASPQLGRHEATLAEAIRVIESAGLEPPTVAELEALLGVGGLQQLLRFGAERGTIVPVERERYFSKSALTEFGRQIREVAVNKAITAQALRDQTGLSRKFLIPLLEWADRTGITRRSGDSRVLVDGAGSAN